MELWSNRHYTSGTTFHNGIPAKPISRMANQRNSLLTMAELQISTKRRRKRATTILQGRADPYRHMRLQKHYYSKNIWANSNLKRLLTEFKIGRTPLKIKSFLSIQIHKHISMMMFLTKLTFNWLVNGVRIAKEFWCVITRCSTSRSRELAPQGLPRTLIHQAMRQLTGN
jgi:hypothetical protein